VNIRRHHAHLRANLCASHNGLACTYYATGDLDQARQHWERALALYADLGVPEAEQVRAKLESLGTATPKPSNRARPPP